MKIPAQKGEASSQIQPFLHPIDIANEKSKVLAK
jgi:hypothetical protein